METTNAAPLANTIHDCCRRLTLGRTKINELIASGELKAVKAGDRVLVLESELQRFLSELPAVKPTRVKHSQNAKAAA